MPREFALELYIVDERLPFVDYINFAPIEPAYEKMDVPVFLCILLISLLCGAQDSAMKSNPDKAPSILDSDNSIMKYAESSERHTMLFSALRASELDAVLGYDGQFTVFAPSNLAFEKLSEVTVHKLLDPKNKKTLRAVLSYHIIAGKLSASKILKAMCSGMGKATFTTILGEKITATMSGTDIILTDQLGKSAKITLADSNSCNGVIHEIDSVFIPVKI